MYTKEPPLNLFGENLSENTISQRPFSAPPPHHLCFRRPLTRSQLSVGDHSMGGARRTFSTSKWQRSADAEQTLQLASVHCKSRRESKNPVIQSSSHLRLHVLIDLKLEVQHQTRFQLFTFSIQSSFARPTEVEENSRVTPLFTAFCYMMAVVWDCSLVYSPLWHQIGLC